MLQNRVDPFGNLIKTKARGAWMGNRGVIHNADQQIIRPFKLNAWITCQLEFKNRKRVVMTPDRWTELFFMDEATSFAAGHRPCAECRREDFTRFKSFWLLGNPEYEFDLKTPIQKIDQILHKERIGPDKSKIIFEEFSNLIPNGSFVSIDKEAHLIYNQEIFRWTPFGYEKGIGLPDKSSLNVLTPKSIVNTFRAGYEPESAKFNF
jgi:hypothetical protein